MINLDEAFSRNRTRYPKQVYCLNSSLRIGGEFPAVEIFFPAQGRLLRCAGEFLRMRMEDLTPAVEFVISTAGIGNFLLWKSSSAPQGSSEKVNFCWC